MSSKRKKLPATGEKSNDKRARGTGRNFIDSLPEEVLCMVFDQLSLYDVKNASLVCRKWNEILFSGAYANRFVFSIRAECWTPEDASRIMDAIDVLAKSKRCYRRSAFLGGDLDDGFEEVWDEAPKQILRSNSVKHLRVESKVKIFVDMPQLETFDGPFVALHQPDDNLPLGALTNLKHIIIHPLQHDWYMPDEEPSAIRRLTSVESIKWNIEVSNEMFIVLCETCTQLKDMCFYDGLWTATMDIFENVSKLVNLRSFKIKSGNMQAIDLLVFDYDFSKLHKLEELELGTTDVDYLKLPKSLRTLAVYVNPENEPKLMHSIASGGTELTTLKLTFDEMEFELNDPVITLKALTHLKNLETLVFTGAYLKKTSFLCLDTPLDRVHKLLFRDCYMGKTKCLQKIEEKFPNLKTFKWLDSSWDDPLLYRDSDWD